MAGGRAISRFLFILKYINMKETLRMPEHFSPLHEGEMHEIHGGFLAAILAGLIIAAGTAIINDWDNFKRGLRGLPEIK